MTSHHARFSSVAVAFLLVTCGQRSLSDADLTSYAATRYDAREMEGKHLVLGVHGGVPVVVDFPCSDLCPANTTRIIHYDLPADLTCTAKGGVVVKLDTPVGTGYLPTPYCVPRVLAGGGSRQLSQISRLSNNALKLTAPRRWHDRLPGAAA